MAFTPAVTTEVVEVGKVEFPVGVNVTGGVIVGVVASNEEEEVVPVSSAELDGDDDAVDSADEVVELDGLEGIDTALVTEAGGEPDSVDPPVALDT